jgi:TolB-like protein
VVNIKLAGGIFLKTSFYAKGMLFILCFSVFALIMGNTVVAASELKRVVIVPFKIKAEKDLTFLKEGIADMLESRLSWDDKVTVISREETKRALESIVGPLDETKAREIGAKLDADHVLFGSLTIFGNSMSIDAKLVDVSGNRPPLTFFSQSQGMDEVIPKINLFAADINEKVFGRVLQAKTTVDQPQETQHDIHAHPEKLMQNGFAGED